MGKEFTSTQIIDWVETAKHSTTSSYIFPKMALWSKANWEEFDKAVKAEAQKKGYLPYD